MLDQAASLARRAERLVERAQHPFTRDQITLVDAAASLRTQAERLTELEDLLDVHGVDAVPPGHA